MRQAPKTTGPFCRPILAPDGTEEVLAAPLSPYEDPFVGRVNGSVRRERLDQVISSTNGTYGGPPATTPRFPTADDATTPSPWTARSLDLCKGPSAAMLSR